MTADEQYTIHRKFFQFFGASFRVTDQDGHLVAFCHQKAFKPREDITLYTDDSQTTPVLSLKARNVIDFSATYDVTLPSGQAIGSLRRKGLTSSFIRDTWLIFDPNGAQVAQIRECNAFAAVLRRMHELFAMLSPQKFDIITTDGRRIARLRQHFNLLLYRMGVKIELEDEALDELVIVGAACLLAAIEGRQS